jgi:hypothetical protein
MHSSSREDIVKCYDALHDAVSDVLEVHSDALTTPECLALLELLETETRRLPVAGHSLINKLARQASDTELGGKLSHALANRLRISRGEAADASARPTFWGRVIRSPVNRCRRGSRLLPPRSGPGTSDPAMWR